VAVMLAITAVTVLLIRTDPPMKASVKQPSAPDDNTTIFRQSWSTYDTITEKNYMFHRELYRHVADLLLARHQTGPYRMLDLGCGSARFLAPCLQGAAPAYYQGVDLSLAALEEARKHLRGLPRVSFIHNDMLQAVEEDDSAYDIIFSGFALHHLDANAKQRFFHACASRLKPNGTFILIDLVREEGQTREQYLNDYVGVMRTSWTEVRSDQLEEACAHITAYDFPETIGDLSRMARQATLPKTRLLNRFAQHHILLFSA
jgi:SAM-dependent methyltransferase